MTHSYAWHDSFIRAIWLIFRVSSAHGQFENVKHVRHDSFVCAAWHIHFIEWLIHVKDMTHISCAFSAILFENVEPAAFVCWHDSFVYVTGLIHICAMSPSPLAEEIWIKNYDYPRFRRSHSRRDQWLGPTRDGISGCRDHKSACLLSMICVAYHRIGDVSHTWMSHGTHMNESCHTFEWYHIYEWVMWHIWISYVTHLSVITHMDESCDTCASVMSYVRMMSHVRMSHVTHVNGPWHKYEWVMWHIWIHHVTRARMMSHIWMSHVIHINEQCHTCARTRWHVCVGGGPSNWAKGTQISIFGVEILLTHKWMSHGTYLTELWGTYQWVMSQVRTSHVTRTNEACVPLIVGKQMKALCQISSRVMWHISMRQVTHTNESRVPHIVGKQMKESRQICQRVMRHIPSVMSHLRMSHAYPILLANKWKSAVRYLNGSCGTYQWVMSHIRMSHAYPTNSASWGGVMPLELSSGYTSLTSVLRFL